MDAFTESNLELIFRHAAIWDFSEAKFNGHMINILMLVDGRRNLSDIARQINLEADVVICNLNRLHNLGIVEKVSGVLPAHHRPKGKGVYRGQVFDMETAGVTAGRTRGQGVYRGQSYQA